MKLKLDDIVTDELKEYLLTQEGITDVDYTVKDYISTMNIQYNKHTLPKIIIKYIDLFLGNEYPILLEFDKGYETKYKTLTYVVKDMCCDYCYRGLVMDLFDNDKVISVKSNFDFYNSPFNIEFIITYDEKYNEEDLIKYMKDNYAFI